MPARGDTELTVVRGDRRQRRVPRHVGAAFGFAGPFGSYEPFSNVSTGVLTALMWLGRVEIIPVAVLLGPQLLARVTACAARGR